MRPTLSREQRLMRLFRALSGDKQEELARELGVFRTLVSQFENGEVEPAPAYLEGAARTAGISVADGDELLSLHDTMTRERLRQGPTPDDLFDGLAAELRSGLDVAYRRILTLPLPEALPKPEDRGPAEELFRRLQAESVEARFAIVRVAEEFHTWALCERVCAAALEAAPRDKEEAAAWARLAREIAERVRGTEGFRSRLQGFAAAHQVHALRAAGDLNAARAAFEEAKRLWTAGDDPYGVLDPKRLPPH